MWSPMYTPHREDPIYPAKGIKACGVITKLIAHIGDWQRTWVVVLGLLGALNPSPTRYYATPTEFYKLTDYIWISVSIGKQKLNMQTENATINLVIMHL